MSQRVRVGVIGTSWFADQMHLPVLKSHPRAEIAAICGRNHDRAAEMARKYEIPQVFTDYRAMIEKARLDAVVVVTPDDQHYPMTMAAIDAGLHVVCEKPVALNASQAREMYESAEAKGVKHMVNFGWRCLPHTRYIRALIAGGYLGRCFHCDFRYLGDQARQRQYHWRFDQEHSIGILGDFGSHMIDMARWYIGDIARVSAHLATFRDLTGPDGRKVRPANEAAVLAIEFANGAQGAIQVSGLCHVGDRWQEQHYRLHGEAGTLEFDIDLTRAEVRGARAEEGRIGSHDIPQAFCEGLDRGEMSGLALLAVYRRQPVGVRLFVDAIVDDRPVSPSLYDGWKAQEVIDAAVKSHRERLWVTVGQASDNLGSMP